MRIVHLNTTDFGGAAVAAQNLHEALLAQGVESDLLTLTRTRSDLPRHHLVDPFALNGPRWLNSLSYKGRRALEKAGVVGDRSSSPDHPVLVNRPAGHEIFSLPFSHFDILTHPLVKRADVIHLHWVSRGMIDHQRFFQRAAKPVVWTMHDMNPFTGGCHHADSCEGYALACADCPQLADRRKAHDYWKLKRHGLEGIPKGLLVPVSPSAWLAARAQRSSILSGLDCAVIPNGFDVTRFRLRDQTEARRALGLPEGKRIVLFSAFDTGNSRKGGQFLLPALAGIGDVVLVCMGHAMPAMKGRMEVLSTGFLTDAERIALHYSAADLFVLPSMAENLPNTICEALLCGTPVAAFAVGGIPEQVDASNGQLAPAGDEAGLRHAVTSALARSWDRSAIASAAASRYDRDRVAGAYREIYRRMLA